MTGNEIVLTGRIEKPFEKAEKYYHGIVAVKRPYGDAEDHVKVTSTKEPDTKDGFVSIIGSIIVTRSSSKFKRYDLGVKAEHIEVIEADYYQNDLSMMGEVIYVSELRQTPSGKDVLNIKLAMGESRIPCILWNSNARYAAEELSHGDIVSITGRIQTRSYKKYINDEEYTIPTQDVNVYSLTRIEGDE